MVSISARAPFFERETSCSSNGVEATEKTITLPETEPEVFEAYLHWVYTKEIELGAIEASWKPNKPPTFISIAKLWLFAEAMLDFDLCNELVDIVIRKSRIQKRAIATKTIESVWQRTVTTSKLRVLFMNAFASAPNVIEYFKKFEEVFRTEFKIDTIARFLRGETRLNITEHISRALICEQDHIHSDGTKCEA